MKKHNRIKQSFDSSDRVEIIASKAPGAPDANPSNQATTQQLFETAWANSRRDWELNRLFNAWYYQI